MAVVSVVLPVIQPFTPWGWVGFTYPGSALPGYVSVGIAPLGITLLTVSLMWMLPSLMNALSLIRLTTQAARWESAVIHISGMEFSAAAATYGGRPHAGRQLRAIRPMRQKWATFIIRGACGAIRAPGRLAVSVLAIVLAGVLVTLAFLPASPSLLLGAVAGLVLFAALGPLTEGVRHAVSAASGSPLYGVSDQCLLSYHSLFPLAVIVLVVAVVAIVCSIVSGVATGIALAGSVALGFLSLVARINSAIKGVLPIILLTPIPTPAGDVGIIVRMIWALDGVLFAALAGVAAVFVYDVPFFIVAVAVFLIVIAMKRWRHRRERL
ncbi:hypothetical protein [Lysinibacter sp. HNR]|uniref:hypothetical protein n=1 Tax=Lysinibacter sp. HNR TaxID=3031408 RepID=UPI002435FDEA|nr:hypothetical protein [Lysinibacter sp. HNR]WGD37495.1 hypothetical protein FrondiHNR_00805 [Lysinibacter sp. HNR]